MGGGSQGGGCGSEPPGLFVHRSRLRWWLANYHRMWRISLSGADRKLLPSTSASCHPTGDRVVPLKEGEGLKRGTKHNSADMETCYLTAWLIPFVYCMASPTGILGYHKLPGFLAVFWVLLKTTAQSTVTGVMWLHLGIHVSSSSSSIYSVICLKNSIAVKEMIKAFQGLF